MHRILLLCLGLCALICTGCSSTQTMKDGWKYTSKQYYTYLNTPAEIDMEATGSCENYELALGDAVLEVDNQLQQFVRAMENSDRNPDNAWVYNIMRRFPWLSGVALADASGNPLARYPEYFMKEFDVRPLLEPDPKQRLASLRAYVQSSPLGPEIYLANPVFAGEELRGLVVAYFDPRSLVTFSGDPGSFMLASPGGVLWAGRFDEHTTPVGQTNWEDLLQRRSCGLIGGSGNEFFWTTRYLGNLPIVYAIPTDAGKAVETTRHIDELQHVDLTDAPPMQLQPHLMPGEVGNLGSPDLTPANSQPYQDPDDGVLTLQE